MFHNCEFLTFVLLHISVSRCIIDSHTDTTEAIFIDLSLDPALLRFGNASAADYYRLLNLDGHYLLIGARDVVYNISIANFTEVQSIKWSSEKEDVDECLRKGRSKEECHNYIRVLAKGDSSDVLICGTNSFEPMCRQYKCEKDGNYQLKFDFPGIGLSPYAPNYNSTFLRDGDMLYAGTVSDFSGSDPLIYRRNITKGVDLGIRTSRNDAKFLNEPQFVGSIKDDKYVYLWFREQPSDTESCERAIFSRVARLCRSDNGGPRSYSTEWTSFVKARLNCSILGEFPFYFDKIEAIAKPVEGVYGGENAKLVYAVFGSPLAGISSSAICAFDLSQITKVFSNSSYHRNNCSTRTTAWLRDESSSIHRPGSCVSDSRQLPEETVARVRANTLMDDTVENYFKSPLAVHSGADHFTQISVDPKVQALDKRYYDILYVATNKGNIFKLVNLAGANIKEETISCHHIFTVHVTNDPIRNLMLFKSKELVYIDYTKIAEHYLIAVSDRSVFRVPTTQCSKFEKCDECISLRDPQCAWDSDIDRCVNYVRSGVNMANLKQDVAEGRVQICGTNSDSKRRPAEFVSRLKVDSSILNVVPALASDSNNCSCERGLSMCAPVDSEGSLSVPNVISSESTLLIFCNEKLGILLSVLIMGIILGIAVDRVLICLRHLPKGNNPSSPQKLFVQSFDQTGCKPPSPQKSSVQPTDQTVCNFTSQQRSPNDSEFINAYDKPKILVRPLFCRENSTPKIPYIDMQPKSDAAVSTLPRDHKQMYL